MSKVAVHMRIANLNATNEEVISRQQAIAALVTSWEQLDDSKELIVKANEIAFTMSSDGMPSTALGEEVQQAIEQFSPAYVCAERPLDVSVCAALAAIDLVTAAEEQTGTSTRDMFAAALWSALAYQPALQDARREALRVELRDACCKRCEEASEAARDREDVEDTEFDEEDDEADLAEVKRVVVDAIATLKRNAILDREELNFLWWAQLNRSRLLKKPHSGIAEPVRLIACGIEGARYLKALPAEVHRDLVLRTLDDDPSLNHDGLLKKIGVDREVLNGVFGNTEIVKLVPEIFPLLYSLSSGVAQGIGAKVVRLSSEWASRALLEGAIAQILLSESVES